MNQPSLVYIDANVFLSYMAGQDADPQQYPFAKAFFTGLPSGKQAGVFSLLSGLEILDVLRKWKGWEFETLSRMSTQEDHIKHVIEGARERYAEIITEMLAVPEIRFMQPLHLDITQLLHDALEILSDVKGSVRFYDSCKICGRQNNGQKFLSVHKCVGMQDVIHVLLAKAMKCDAFVTFDRGFLELLNETRIRPVRIEVLRPPKSSIR